MKELCPACEGGGHQFMIKNNQEQIIKCTICEGTGYIIYKDREITEEYIKTIFSSLDQR